MEHEMDGEAMNMVITDNNAYLMAMGEGSRVEIHAVDREKESWTQLETNASAGSDQLVVQDSTGWEVGDKIAIASGSANWTQSEEFTILEISEDGKTITLDSPLQYAHNGETRTYDNGETGDDFLEWDVELRSEVSLLSRNVTIQGDDDSVIDGYGGHTMVMAGATQHIAGVEYFQMGQEDILGKYPVHWHMEGDAEGQYVEGISVHDSYQKGITIHGTSNVRVEDSVIYNHVGHGVFFEDGSENGNLVLGNLVFGTTASESGDPIPTDRSHVSSYWIENPNNVFIGNHAAGSEVNGFMIFPDNEVHGDSLETFVGEMGNMADLIFQNNVAHSNVNFGVSVEGSVNPDTLTVVHGGVQQAEYATIEGLLAYDNRRHGAWIFTDNLIVEDSMFVDNNFGGFLTKGSAFFEDTLIAGNGVGSYTYTQGGTRFDGVHYEDNDLNFFNHTGDTLNGAHSFSNVTTDGGTLRVSFQEGNATTNQRTVLDVDGTLTGIAGATITPGGVDELMAAAPGAYFDEDLNGWVSVATVGTTRFIVSSSDLRVVRSDGVETEEYSYFRNREFLLKNAAGMERDVAYLLDMDVIPDRMTLNVSGLRDGESVVYEISNVGSLTRINNATEVASYESLLTSEGSTYFLKDGSLFVRAVASGNIADISADDNKGEYFATANLVVIGAQAVDTPSNNPELSQDLLDAIAAQPANHSYVAPKIAEATLVSTNDVFELERYESTSDTTVVTDDMARWSDAATWDGDVPAANDIVVIGSGETVVLDGSTTVKGIIVNGGELIIEDDADKTIDLATDYLLVINGGLFQAGTEDDLLDTEFTLTLEGDDPDFDLEVTQIVMGNVENTVFAGSDAMDHDMPMDMPADDPVDEPVDGGTDDLPDDDTTDNEADPDDDVDYYVYDNKINGDSAHDMLIGNAGNELLNGDGGINRLVGGDGEDHFVMRADDGLDIVYDFNAGEDKIALIGMSYEDLIIATYRDSDAVISYGDDRMILRDTNANDLSMSDFAYLDESVLI